MQFIVAAFMILLTTVIHTGGMVIVFKAIRAHGGNIKDGLRRTRIILISGIVLIMMLVLLVEVTCWATTYLVLNAVDGFEKALYFSMVTFTALGYGDIVLDENWRLLGSIEAANGLIIFGWTTAIIVAIVQYIFFGKEHAKLKT